MTQTNHTWSRTSLAALAAITLSVGGIGIVRAAPEPAADVDNAVQAVEKQQTASVSVSFNEDGSVKIDANGEVRTFVPDENGNLPAEDINAWLKSKGLTATVDGKRVAVGPNIAGLDLPVDGEQLDANKLREQFLERVKRIAQDAGIDAGEFDLDVEVVAKSVSASRDADGNITVKIDGESRTFRLDENNQVPAEIQKWLDDNGVEITVDGNSVSVKSGAKAGDAAFLFDGAQGLDPEAINRLIKDALDRAKDELDANRIGVTRNGDATVTVNIGGDSRTFKLDADGEVPADVKQWLDENGVQAVGTRDSIQVERKASRDGQGEPKPDVIVN